MREHLYEDEALHAEVAALRNGFMNNAQALIHGDLHSGSIFANEQGIKVIDPEFAFYGPMGYDIGNVIGNLFFAWANKAYTGGSAECRLAMYLLDNQQDGVPPKVTLPFGMNKLAELLGIGRASLYRAMETLEKKGIVAREGKCIAILKPNDLLHYDGAQGIREDETT